MAAFHQGRPVERDWKKRKKPNLWDDGVQAVWQDICGSAYQGEAPVGGYDFPSGAILSKAQAGDLHVEFGPQVDATYGDFEVSEYSDFAYMTYRGEEGSATTESPFKWAHSLVSFPGFFGAALKSYAELRCVLLAYSVDVDGFDEWFSDQWNLAPGFDFDFITPTPRSQPPALWGGISRVLKPLMTMLPASGPRLSVRHHGKHRTAYGEGKLVDWARITAVAKAAAVQMVADDVCAPKDMKKFEYRVVGTELPDAPTDSDVRIEFKYVRVPNDGEYKRYGMYGIIERAKRTVARLEQRYRDQGVEVNAEMSADKFEVAKVGAVKRGQHVDPLENWWMDEGEDLPDIAEPVKKASLQQFKYVGRANAMDTIVAGRVGKLVGELPRSAQINAAVAKLEEGRLKKQEKDDLRKMVLSVYGDKFLVLIRAIGDLGGDGAGWDWVRQILRQAEVGPELYQHSNLLGIQRAVVHADKGLAFYLRHLGRIVRDYDNWQARNFVLDISSEALATETPALLIGRIVQKKRRYWLHRLKRNAEGRRKDKSNRAHMIVSQLRFAALRKAFVEVKPGGEIDVSRRSIDEAFRESVNSFLRKRKRHDVYVEDVEDVSPETLQKVDDRYGLSKAESFVTMYAHVNDYIGEFVRDLAETYRVVFDGTREHTRHLAELESTSDDEAEDEGFLQYAEETEKEFAVMEEFKPLEDLRKRALAPDDVLRVPYQEMQELHDVAQEEEVDEEEEDYFAKEIADFEAAEAKNHEPDDAKLLSDDGAQAPEEEDSDMGDWGEDEANFTTGVSETAGLCDLLQEIYSEIPNLPRDIAAAMLAKYGELVTVKVCDEAIEDARRCLFSKARRAGAFKDEGPDIL